MEIVAITGFVIVCGAFVGAAVYHRKTQKRRFIQNVETFLRETEYRIAGQENVPFDVQAKELAAALEHDEARATQHFGENNEVSIQLVRFTLGHRVKFNIRLEGKNTRLMWTVDTLGPSSIAFGVSRSKKSDVFSSRIKTDTKAFDKHFYLHSDKPELAKTFIQNNPDFADRLSPLPGMDLSVKGARVYLIDEEQKTHRSECRLSKQDASFAYKAFRRNSTLVGVHKQVTDLMAWIAGAVVERDAARRFAMAISFPVAGTDDGGMYSTSGALKALDNGWDIGSRDALTTQLEELLASKDNPAQSAWDLSRAVHVARMGFAADLISDEESWAFVIRCAKGVSTAYDSWYSFAESLQSSFNCWADGAADTAREAASMKARKKSAIEDLKMSQWNTIPWGLP